MKCDHCENVAAVHLTEIRNTEKTERHVCFQCAAKETGLTNLEANMPIKELLAKFVLAQSKQMEDKTDKPASEES